MFMKVNQDTAATKIFQSRKVGRAAKAVFGIALMFIDRNNLLIGAPVNLQNKMGLGKSDFEIGMRDLKNADLVRKYSKQEYMFNPDLVCYGDERNYYILKDKWERQTTAGLRK